MAKRQSVSDKMMGNKNAEKWTFEEAEAFMMSALELSQSEEYDFIGEVTKELGQSKSTLTYIRDKHPELSYCYEMIRGNCETNCFKNTKKEKINTAAGIVNLKSNHGWTDRVEQKQNIDLNTPILSLDPLSDETDNSTAKDSGTTQTD